MNRLRQPIRAIREPFGTAGLIVACVALIAALGGTALAAKGALTGKQKKEVEKIAKKFAGKPGAAGATGPAGPAGAAGAKGDAGAAGAAGSNGVSVTSKSIPTSSSTCAHQGGTEFTSASGTTLACNGKEGTFGGTNLPEGKTLTGVWAASGFGEAGFPAAGFGAATTGVSYALPLESAPAAHYIAEGAAVPSGCGGTAEAPEAEPGNLCVFATAELHTLNAQVSNDATYGFQVSAFSSEPGAIVMSGSWAVTAE